MRALIQRVNGASVSVDGEIVGSVKGSGLCVLLGVTHTDTQAEVVKVASKIAGLRIMEGELSVADTGGEVLVISQFTLYGDSRKGRRPSWVAAAPGEVAAPLVDAVVKELREVHGLTVATGVFGANMQVSLTNDGPVTLWVEA
ncbi:D-tyrosyl-tRNA(Tyr) deacylase [Gleimia coleocanis DSM 15436]|uniref:D-aminoacyl-tRNA deacylase n=1 Tax=Gleimia coleocanis DSM 15436 TaxID=525245 RepID=C0VYU2_9ACTO|nr:D-aminoacyl-tRNA deacylase [Gleimia coleocanis]EEH64595.1 D-tyrosyl-tRNA(Tyr) deacylase [Gleimia coleocanis DSM 15436]